MQKNTVTLKKLMSVYMMPSKWLKGQCKVKERKFLGWEEFWVGWWQVKERWECIPGRWGLNHRRRGSGMGSWLLPQRLGKQLHFPEIEQPENKEKVTTFWNEPGDRTLPFAKSLDFLWTVRSYCRFSHKLAHRKVVSEKVIKWGQDETGHSETNACKGKHGAGMSWNDQLLQKECTGGIGCGQKKSLVN